MQDNGGRQARSYLVVQQLQLRPVSNRNETHTPRAQQLVKHLLLTLIDRAGAFVQHGDRGVVKHQPHLQGCA